MILGLPRSLIRGLEMVVHRNIENFKMARAMSSFQFENTPSSTQVVRICLC